MTLHTLLCFCVIYFTIQANSCYLILVPHWLPFRLQAVQRAMRNKKSFTVTAIFLGNFSKLSSSPTKSFLLHKVCFRIMNPSFWSHLISKNRGKNQSWCILMLTLLLKVHTVTHLKQVSPSRLPWILWLESCWSVVVISRTETTT